MTMGQSVAQSMLLLTIVVYTYFRSCLKCSFDGNKVREAVRVHPGVRRETAGMANKTFISEFWWEHLFILFRYKNEMTKV